MSLFKEFENNLKKNGLYFHHEESPYYRVNDKKAYKILCETIEEELTQMKNICDGKCIDCDRCDGDI